MAHSLLRRDAIHRGTFLFERTCGAEIREYDAVLDRISSDVKRGGHDSAWIDAAREQAASVCPGVFRGQTPKWSFFTDELIHPSTPYDEHSPSASVLLDPKQQLEEASVFAPAFRIAASNLIAHLCDDVCIYSRPVELSFWSMIAREYVRRLAEQAQYVLYTTYVASGSTYSGWASSFLSSDTGPHPWADIANSYPVLLRFLYNTHRQFRESVSEMISRLESDSSELCRSFRIKPGDPLSSCEPMLSDPHRDGRTVCRLEFASGLTIIYKPKPLGIEEDFNAFVRSHLAITGFEVLKVLSRDGYGWVEDARRSESSYETITEHVGRAAAWLWLLNATDMHTDNLSPGEDGVRGLDLETLLSVPITVGITNAEFDWRDHSVASTLLIEPSLENIENQLGYSGFRAAGFTTIPYARLVYSIVDDRIVADQLPAGAKVPTVQATHRPTRAQVGRILEAFSVAARDLAPHALCFTESLPPERALRYVVRPTQFYFQVLHRSWQPRFLRDGGLLSLELLRLHLSAPETNSDQQSEAIHTIIDDEVQQLLNGDIPYLSREAGGTSLRLSSGLEVDFFHIAGQDAARVKITSASPADIREQHDLLAISLGFPSKSIANRHATVQTAADEQRASMKYAAGPLEQLAEHLMASSNTPDDAMARWVTLSGGTDPEQLNVTAGDTSLFSGNLGVILALQAAEPHINDNSTATRLQLFLDQQAAVLAPVFSNCSSSASVGTRPLGLAGLGGMLFAAAVLCSRSPDRWYRLVPEVDKMLDCANRWLSEDRWFDVIAGAAGLVLGCEQVVRLAPSRLHQKATATIEAASVHLARSATFSDGAAAWVIPTERLPLVGFAHGWAGCVCALDVALRRSGDRQIRLELQSCLASASRFPEAQLNSRDTWLDYRGSSKQKPRYVDVNRSWCNGTTGILRGLLCIDGHGHSALAGVARQIEATLVDPAIEAKRYCCGLSGEVDAAIDCGGYSPSRESKLEELMEQLLEKSLSKKTDAEIISAPDLFFPNLYWGTAGLVYTAIRVKDRGLPTLSGWAPD